MYGDTEVIRKRATQLREQGVELRGLADRLVARTEATGWTGRAAEAMRARVRERASHLRAVAAEHDTAAESLERHAREVESRTDRIADAERKAAALVTDGRASAEFDPPPRGHKDWLAVSLPGL